MQNYPYSDMHNLVNHRYNEMDEGHGGILLNQLRHLLATKQHTIIQQTKHISNLTDLIQHMLQERIELIAALNNCSYNAQVITSQYNVISACHAAGAVIPIGADDDHRRSVSLRLPRSNESNYGTIGSRVWHSRTPRIRDFDSYELSPDLQQKQVDFLETKYSGRKMSASEAAICIQRAYRQHILQMSFKRIRANRLSKHFSPTSDVGDIWQPQQPQMNHNSHKRNNELTLDTKQIYSNLPYTRLSQHINEYDDQLTGSQPSLSNASSCSSSGDHHQPSTCGGEYLNHQTQVVPESHTPSTAHSNSSTNDDDSLTRNYLQRQSTPAGRRTFRVGITLFNKKPEKGMRFLIERGFVADIPAAVAKFLFTTRGLSRKMIGEYLGDLQSAFSQQVLSHYIHQMKFNGKSIDVALREFLASFRLPGEAQKVEKLMEVFANRYWACNGLDGNFLSEDAVFILAYAIMMLHTDLHSPNVKPANKMTVDAFIRNLKGVDNNRDLNREMLEGIYSRIRSQEIITSPDHCQQVLDVEQRLIGKAPPLALPYRRLVCFCRFFEVPDLNKKDTTFKHARDVYLFNDVLLITKATSKKKDKKPSLTFKGCYQLFNMQIQTIKESPFYPMAFILFFAGADKSSLILTSTNNHDRDCFITDLQESIKEVNELEHCRVSDAFNRQSVYSSATAGDVECAVDESSSRAFIVRSPSIDSNLSCGQQTPVNHFLTSTSPHTAVMGKRPRSNSTNSQQILANLETSQYGNEKANSVRKRLRSFFVPVKSQASQEFKPPVPTRKFSVDDEKLKRIPLALYNPGSDSNLSASTYESNYDVVTEDTYENF